MNLGYSIYRVKVMMSAIVIISFLQGCANGTGGYLSAEESQESMMSAAFDAEEEMAMDHVDDAGERTNEPQTEEGIQAVPARWAANTRIVDMPVLDFADDERLVMHAYFGLFIYNLSTGEIEDSLDLQTLGEYDDSACEISVSQNADTIWIRTEASGSLYEYDRQEKKLAVIEDLTDKIIFNSFVPTKNISQEELTVKPYYCSERSVLFADGSYGTLTVGNGKITDISYISGDMEWILFGGESSEMPELVRQDDYFYTQFAEKGAKSAGDMFETCCMMINLGEYAGLCELSGNEEYLEEIQKEWQVLKLAASGKEVEKTEDRGCYIIYINASDTSSGSGLQKGENEKYIYLKRDRDGWYLDGILHDALPPEDWWK